MDYSWAFLEIKNHVVYTTSNMNLSVTYELKVVKICLYRFVSCNNGTIPPWWGC